MLCSSICCVLLSYCHTVQAFAVCYCPTAILFKHLLCAIVLLPYCSSICCVLLSYCHTVQAFAVCCPTAMLFKHLLCVIVLLPYCSSICCVLSCHIVHLLISLYCGKNFVDFYSGCFIDIYIYSSFFKCLATPF